MTSTNQLSPESKLSYSVDGAADATGIPKSTLWKHIKDGTLESHKVGRRRIIPHNALHRLVNGGRA